MQKDIILSCKKIDFTGKIERNCDYGVGYTVVWEHDIKQNLKQRSAATPVDILKIVSNQLDFLIHMNREQIDKKYIDACEKVKQAICILGE